MIRKFNLKLAPYFYGFFLTQQNKEQVELIVNGLINRVDELNEKIYLQEEKICFLQNNDDKEDLLKKNQALRDGNLELLNQKNNAVAEAQNLLNKNNALKLRVDELERKSSKINQLENLEHDFKEHLIQKHLHNQQSLMEKDLSFILELCKVIDNDKNEKAREQFEDEKEIRLLNYNDYIKGLECVCGNSKSSFSKGCENCRKIADSLRHTEDIGMDFAWKEVWKKVGNKIDFTV